MSISNMFQQLVSGSPKATDAGTVAVASNRKVGPNDPASLGRIIAIAKFFRRKNLLAETDPAWLAAFERLAVFDSDTGYWVPPEGFTQGEAEALQERLYALPWKGKSVTPASKVTVSQGAPLPKAAPVTDSAIAARVEAASAASKAPQPQPASPVDLKAEILSALAEMFADQGSFCPGTDDKPQDAGTRISGTYGSGNSGQVVPEGYEVRVGKKGPYLAKRR